MCELYGHHIKTLREFGFSKKTVLLSRRRLEGVMSATCIGNFPPSLFPSQLLIREGLGRGRSLSRRPSRREGTAFISWLAGRRGGGGGGGGGGGAGIADNSAEAEFTVHMSCQAICMQCGITCQANCMQCGVMQKAFTDKA